MTEYFTHLILFNEFNIYKLVAHGVIRPLLSLCTVDVPSYDSYRAKYQRAIALAGAEGNGAGSGGAALNEAHVLGSSLTYAHHFYFSSLI